MYHVKKMGYVIGGGGAGRTPPADPEDEELRRLRQKYLRAREEVEKTGKYPVGLKALYEKMLNEFTSGFTVNPEVPEAMASAFRRDLQSFSGSVSGDLAEAVTAQVNAVTAVQLLAEVSPVAEDGLARLGAIIQRHDREMRTALALIALGILGYQHFLFLSERRDTTCEICESRHGGLLTLSQLNGSIPPLHPNCRCRLVALDEAGLLAYNINKEGFISRLDDVVENAGGIFRLDRSFLGGGITERTLIKLEIPDTPAISGLNAEGPLLAALADAEARLEVAANGVLSPAGLFELRSSFREYEGRLLASAGIIAGVEGVLGGAAAGCVAASVGAFLVAAAPYALAGLVVVGIIYLISETAEYGAEPYLEQPGGGEAEAGNPSEALVPAGPGNGV